MLLNFHLKQALHNTNKNGKIYANNQKFKFFCASNDIW